MRDLIDSALIGSLASFLPFWIWDSRADQIAGVLALIGVAYVHSQTVACMECVTKKDPQSCNSGGPKR